MDCGPESTNERIARQIQEHAARLAELQELQKLLESHPEIERAFTLLQRAC